MYKGFKTNRKQTKVSTSDTVKNYNHSKSELESDSNSTSINLGTFVFFTLYLHSSK